MALNTVLWDQHEICVVGANGNLTVPGMKVGDQILAVVQHKYGAAGALTGLAVSGYTAAADSATSAVNTTGYKVTILYTRTPA